ncbi:MAG TPA: type IV secretion system protein TraC, partial [Candidatus Aenigmarchaeota archaeon]|nr:type IV secretion system protein TraC [Candidatus Aenigmarchaeota archaeon]
WECVPRISNGDNTVQLIKSLFELGYPDIILQIILFADWHIAPILDRYASLTDTDNMLLFEWTKSQIEHYKAHTWHGFTETVPVPVRNFRLFFAVKIPYSDYTKELEKILEIKRSVEGVLSSGYFYPRSVPVEEFLHLVRGIFNPDRPREKYPIYDPDIEIRRQVILAETKIVRHARYLEIGDRFVKTLTVQGYRPIVDPSITQDLIGDTIVGKNLEQIPVPFILTLNVYLNRDLLKEKIQKKATLVLAQRAAGAIAPKLAKKQEELHWAIQHMEGKNTPVQVYLTLTLFCPPDKGATANITNTVKGFWENLGFKLQEDFFIGIPIFISALPFGLKFEACSDLSRFKTTFADAASCVAPTQTGWSGTKKPYALFVSRRGQLMSFDIFDSNSNYNALIAAQSGAGKSFFTNYLLTSYYRAGAKIWVIDVGRSYKKLCETFKGDFLVFSPDSHLCLNPFTNVENIDKELELIVPLLCQMMKPTEKATDWEKAALEQVIKDVFTQYGNKTTVTHIAEALRDHDDQRKKDMALMLTPYTKYGRFGKWFEGESTIDLGKTRFMTLELEELKQMRELQEVILLLVIYFIKHEMYLGGKDVLKIVTIDEAWDLFSGENTALFIESGYRRFRKYKGAAITITQSVEDFYKNEATKAITRNSNFWLLLSQLPEAIDSAVRSGYISLHPFQQEVLKSVHTIKGLYSEIFFRVNDTQEFGVGRLFPDPFSYYVFTTDAADLTLLKHIQEITGGDVTQAIRTASFIVKELMSKTKLNMFEAVRELANTPVRQLETLVNKQHQHETKKAA